MCHVIRPYEKEGNPFFLLRNRTKNALLVGNKQFLICDGRLDPPFIEDFTHIFYPHPYGLKSEQEKNTQQITFLLPTYHTHNLSIDISRTIPDCGYHISPSPINVIIDSASDLIRIPVVFRSSDILFYDGKDVSVSTFFIPEPYLIEEALDSSYKRDAYSEIYKVIKRYYDLDNIFGNWIGKSSQQNNEGCDDNTSTTN